MRADALLSFVPIGSPLSIVLNSGQNTRSSVIDLLGLGAGVPPNNVIIGDQLATFGAADAMGVGGMRPELNVTVGTAGVGAGATLNVALQAAADLGSPTYQPSTWNTLAETGAIAVTNLTLNNVVARFPWLPPFPANLRPRYLSLLFSVAGANLTAGTISSALVVPLRDDWFVKYAQKNYAVQ